MSVKMKFGSKDIPFVYKGDKLVYPNPIKDGLLLWYDFKGMRNTDTNKEVAKDLSLNGNDGTLTNFNFTEESGYKDNTLVFDGVDDKLVIPELELDETAMSVMHDGKIYSYEDDKVLTVGEDGEIVGSGKNLLLSSDIPQSSSEYILANYTYSEQLVLDEPFTVTAKVKLGEGVQYPRFYNTGGHVTGAFGVPSKIQEFPDGTTIWKLTGTWKIANAGNDFLRLYQVVSGDTYPVSTVEWCKLERGTTETPYVSSSSDYKSTTLSPTSLADLQLYNKTLRKDELLHNAESKGLKKLKPGVVVQDGLVLHYDFSHESNTSEYKGKAFDYSGNGNHGVLENFNFTEESGYESKKLKFDGVDDGIRQNITPSLRINGDITLESLLTFNQPHDTTDHFGWDWYIMCGNNQQVEEGFGLLRSSSGRLSFRYGGAVLDTDYNPEPNVTHHLLAKFDGDKSELSFYLDGIRISQSIRTDINPQIPRRPLGIGHATYYSSPRAAVSIGSVRIYNRALTAEEIQHNYAIEKEKFDIIEGEM